MLLEAIYHSTYSEYCHAIDKNTFIVRLRAKKNDLKRCVVCFGDRMFQGNPVRMENVEMFVVASDRFYDYFEATVHTKLTRVCYYFMIYDGIESLYYYDNDFHEKLDYDRQKYFTFHYIREEDIAEVPGWAKEAVIYQIFPDSFVGSGDKAIRARKEIKIDNGVCSRNMNGGTLRDIIDNIPYIVELGINCIYLNPIFAANSWHKYDTIDYYSVDPCFGSNEDFKELVKKCHESGVRVVLDAVFNHSGPDFFAFRDLREKGEKSEYKDWFYIYDFPLRYEKNPNYECFAYVETMPKLNTGKKEVVDYFVDVGKYWIKEADIDGWRLDVANEVNHDFWREFRKAVKAVKPDALLIGEIWDDARAWVQGDQFDSLMNYNFTYACIDYFAKSVISAVQFDARINYLLMRYKHNIQYAQMNLLDSHDVIRFLSYADGDIRRLKTAALFQMMHVGMPSIYYGDEKGLMGREEVEYRKPMKWDDDEVSTDIFNYYKKIIAIRKKYMKSMLGKYVTKSVDLQKNIYAFSRQADDEELLVVINNSETVQTFEIDINRDTGKVYEEISGKMHNISNGKISLEIDALSGAVFKI
ncbi:MAG: alpha-glycosidase [Clostridia bacterium]|nr:alpha-glycosidase [Clostridia bacterium]